MSLHTRIPLACSVIATAALLSACGGGQAPQAAEQTVISGRAVDGPLAGATACYDTNDNGRCDSGEPLSEPTTADGSFRIAVAAADAGRHAVVVDVPATAVDADTNAAVGTAFTLRTPATGTGGSQSVFVSPLTTLVQAHMDATGADRATAAAFVQQQAGTGFSPLTDFTLDNGEPARQTARVARLVQLTANEQRNTLAAVVGTPDRDGNPVTSADLEREVLGSLVSALPLVAGTLTDPGLAAASGHTLQALLRVAARSLALQLDLTADTVRMAATLQRLAEPPVPTVPVATGTLRGLRFTDDNNWLFRMQQASAADNVADANGYVRYYDWYLQSTGNATTGTSVTQGGVVQPGSSLNNHWNGTAWRTRAAQDRYLSRIRDTQGRSDYNFGDNLDVGIGIRRVEDISGEAIESIVRRKIRRFPGSANGVSFANWGPSDLTRYGSATFPAGSYLVYQTTTPTSTAISYNPQATNQVQLYAAAVAAGGDVSTNPASACNDTAANIEATLTPAATLEDMMARNRGTPCVYPQSGTAPNETLAPDEWWGNSTVGVGDLPGLNALPPNTGTVYNTTLNVRVSFAASGNRITYWRCYRRVQLNSPRNCEPMGLGTWSIQTLGDARVLSFSTAPALAQRLGYSRHFVERGGRVYFANKSPVGISSTDLRLNLTAANAVFHALGLPRTKPVTEPGTATGARAAALVTVQGVFGEGGPSNAMVWRFGPNGRFFMAEAKPFLSTTREQSGAELGWFDYDPATQQFSTLLEVDSSLTSGTSHPSVAEMTQPLTITPTQIGIGGGSLSRLETVSTQTSLVGMWAFDSPTDLSKAHLVFFSNGKFMVITHAPDPTCPGGTSQCPPGVEYSDYTYDAATGTLTVFNPLYDTNGSDGAFDTRTGGSNNTSDTVTVIIAADGLSATLTDAGNNVNTIYRILPQ